ncbi:MAG: hypothetical protein DYH12_27845 [Sorangiineae bacterium PRO1]|nr:hypothetical protein [Sorangiineae bacterium PRO1]
MKRPRAQQARTSTVAAIVVGISLAVYLRSLDFEFTYDDHHHFVRNPFVQDLGNLSRLLPWRFFDQEFPDQARPVLVLTHFLDRWLGGSSAVCHLQSALWHAATAGLVFALGRSLGFALRTAGLAGVLFGLHPALVEAVAGISNREDVLAAFFGLAALLGARRVLTGDLSSLGLVAAAFAVALLSKESALAIPLLCLTLALCSPRFRPRERPRRDRVRVRRPQHRRDARRARRAPRRGARAGELLPHAGRGARRQGAVDDHRCAACDGRHAPGAGVRHGVPRPRVARRRRRARRRADAAAGVASRATCAQSELECECRKTTLGPRVRGATKR